MFLNALLVSLAVGVCYFTNEWFCRLFNDKPIIIGTIVGFLLGDPVTGIICGGTYELIFLGAVNIGGTVPSDALTGTAIATAFIILTDMDIEEAMALAIPVGLLMGQIQMMTFIIPSFFNSYIDKLIEDENDKMFGWMVALTLLMRCFFESFLTFLAIYLGTDIITNIMNALPEAVTGGLTVAGGMLAAVGFAMLLRMIWTKKLAVYFFVGFFLTTYLGIPTLGIAIAGVLYCIIRYYTLIDSPKNLMNQNENMAMEGDDLFND